MLIFIYIGLAFLVGLLGWNRKLGFFIHFLLALLLTPVVMLVFHVVARLVEARQREKLQEKALHARILAEDLSERAAKVEQASLRTSDR